MKTNRLLGDKHELNFSLQARGICLTKAHRREVRRILSSALGRFGHRLRTVQVWLEGGGVDNRCRIDIKFRPHGGISVSAKASDELTATAKAANCARELVDRRVKKLRARRRQPVRQ